MAADENEMSVEAQIEATELDPLKPEKRGYESLRGVRRSTAPAFAQNFRRKAQKLRGSVTGA